VREAGVVGELEAVINVGLLAASEIDELGLDRGYLSVKLGQLGHGGGAGLFGRAIRARNLPKPNRLKVEIVELKVKLLVLVIEIGDAGGDALLGQRDLDGLGDGVRGAVGDAANDDDGRNDAAEEPNRLGLRKRLREGVVGALLAHVERRGGGGVVEDAVVADAEDGVGCGRHLS